MIEVEKLKQKILDLAIRGKLVPQNQNDEPASVLIEKIKKEKEQLVKQGKIKASKNDSYIYKGSDNCYYENESRIDFEPPLETNGNIIWLRGSSFIYKMESTKPTSSNFEYIDIEAINNKTNTIEKTKLISSSKAPSRATRKVYSSSTLFSMVRPYLRNIAYVGDRYKDCIASTGFYICTPQPFINEKYLYYLLTSDYVVNSLNNYMKGDNSPSINTGDLENLLFPIPSLEYQHKAVQLIEIISPIIEKITNENDRLTTLINQTKLRILESIFGENSSYKSYYKNYIPLSDLFESISTVGMEVKNRDVSKMGKYPVVGQGKELVDGYHNDDKKIIKDYPVIVFGDHTRIIKYIDFEFVPGADGTKILKPKVYPKYLYYCCLYASNKIEDRGYNRHFALLRNYLVPNIKDLLKQKEIVNKIDIIYKQLEIMLD